MERFIFWSWIVKVHTSGNVLMAQEALKLTRLLLVESLKLRCSDLNFTDIKSGLLQEIGKHISKHLNLLNYLINCFMFIFLQNQQLKLRKEQYNNNH